MKIFDFIKPVMKWWWLILLSTVISTGASYWISRPLPPVYLSHTTLMVGRAISDPNPSGNEFGMAQQLAIYYTSIAMREPVHGATRAALGLDALPEYTAQTVPNSPFIEIAVTDTDPYRAMVVANELARQLILQSPTAPQQEDIERDQFISEQLAQIQVAIVETQKAIEEKQLLLTDLSSATEIQDVQAEIGSLQTKLSLLQNNYVDLVANSSGAINTLTVIETASVPMTPIGPNKLLIIAFAAAAGLILAVAIAYLIEFLDRTIKTPEEVETLLQAPVLGYIHEFNRGEIRTSYPVGETRSPAAEAFRTLRTNIGFAAVGKPFKTLLITSARQGEGKTTISINLALSMAQADKKVRLVDTDLRRPNVHFMLNIPGEPGFSNAFQDQESVLNYLVPSPLNANLDILPAGKPPPNPTELINSGKMDQILSELQQETDLLILDCTPIIIPDAAILASKVDGVLLVIQPGKVRYEVAEKVAEQIRRSGGRLIGVVFNQLNYLEAVSYTNYQYYSYHETSKSKQKSALKRLQKLISDRNHNDRSNTISPKPGNPKQP